MLETSLLLLCQTGHLNFRDIYLLRATSSLILRECSALQRLIEILTPTHVIFTVNGEQHLVVFDVPSFKHPKNDDEVVVADRRLVGNMKEKERVADIAADDTIHGGWCLPPWLWGDPKSALAYSCAASTIQR